MIVKLNEFVSICNRKESDNSKVILFGASEYGKIAKKILEDKYIYIDYFADNDVKKQGKVFEDKKVINISQIKENDIVLITSMYFNAIENQLKEKKIKYIYYINNLYTYYNYRDDFVNRYKDIVDIGKSSIIGKNVGINYDCEKLSSKVHFILGENSLIFCNIGFQNNNGLITIGDRSYIADGTKLLCVNEIDIGNDVLISWDCTIYDNDSHNIEWENRKYDVLNMVKDYKNFGDINKHKDWNKINSKKIKINDKVWIGFGVTILKGVVIGEGAVIAAKSVVTKNVQPYTVVAGNPARIVKYINNERKK